MNDSSLRQDIIDELDFEPSVDSSHVGVAVSDGIVTLSGHVATYAEKVRIEEVVWQVRGVQAIAEEIDVRPAGIHRTSDDEIAKRALNQIKWSTVVPDGVIHVKVHNGWVTLSGAVDWQYQKSAAYESVRRLAGVRGVSNLVEIKPAVSAGDVRTRIEEALKRNASVEAHTIEIKVGNDGLVTLEGRIKAWPERSIIERAAWSVPGVKSVEDRLTL